MEIITTPNPLLRKKSTRVGVIDDEINPEAKTPLDGHKNPIPLPNLDCNIVCGNSLIDEFNEIKLIDEKFIEDLKDRDNVKFNEGGTYKEMHFFALPWPKDLLEQMHEETVKLRVTLSYYIEPSPSFKNDYQKYRLASAGLNFDVNTPGETREQFIARNNQKQNVQEKSKNDTDRWKVGINLRKNSTVQSDWFECTARELAACNEIAVFPQGGWWKFRKIANIHNRIKYSLVVSIETSETEIYDAVRIAVGQAIPVEVRG